MRRILLQSLKSLRYIDVMYIYNALVVFLFGAVASAGFQGCTSKQNTTQTVSSIQTAPSMKCSDGSDPIQAAGVCEGSWSPRNAAKGGPHAAECQFVGKLVNCETMGYTKFAGDGRNLCYGETTFPYGGESVTAEQCLAKHGMPSHASKFTLNCCKK